MESVLCVRRIAAPEATGMPCPWRQFVVSSDCLLVLGSLGVVSLLPFISFCRRLVARGLVVPK